MVRDIIEIDEDLCTGCGNCVPGCHEGALRIIDGKARLISDLMCDGLGACVGHCPTGAMKVVRKEAAEYDERRVMKENIIPAGANTIRAHLDHLRDHGETGCLEAALAVLAEMGITEPPEAVGAGSGRPACGSAPAAAGARADSPAMGSARGVPVPVHGGGGCPGSAIRQFAVRNGAEPAAPAADVSAEPSALGQWPVQLHLLNPAAPYFRGADVLLAADCTAYALGGFHSRYLKGKTLAIACPKLDSGLESCAEKITAMIDSAGIETLTVMIMEVPCCSSLLSLASAAAAKAGRKVPIKKIVVSVEGEILGEEWV